MLAVELDDDGMQKVECNKWKVIRSKVSGLEANKNDADAA